MTWPFENDTSTIINKLAKKNLKADKTRNLLMQLRSQSLVEQIRELT